MKDVLDWALTYVLKPEKRIKNETDWECFAVSVGASGSNKLKF